VPTTDGLLSPNGPVATARLFAGRLQCGPMGIDRAQLIDLRKVSDPKGNLTPIEGGLDVPFEIRRVYYTYDIPGGETRGGHAHRALEEFIVAASGSFEVFLDDGLKRASFFLNRSYYGLYVPQMVWRHLSNFSSGSVCLVLASDRYDEADYIRTYDHFIETVKTLEG